MAAEVKRSIWAGGERSNILSRRDERVRSGATADVEDVLAGLEPSQRERIRYAGERLGRRFGDAGELVRVVEVFSPRPAGRKDELVVGRLRDRGVHLLDLDLEELDVDVSLASHA